MKGRKRTEEEIIRRKILNEENNIKYKEFFEKNQNMLKVCKVCSKEKELRYFMSNFDHKNKCKDCHSRKIKKWRNENPTYEMEINRKIYEKSSEIIRSEKQKNQCKDCGKKYPYYVMDFHHEKDKILNVSKMTKRGEKGLRKEIEKCELVCSNCHRNETQKRLSNFVCIKQKDIKIKEYEEENCVKKTCKKCKIEKCLENFYKSKSGSTRTYCKSCIAILNSSYRDKNKGIKTPTERYLEDFKDNKNCTDCGEKFRYWNLDFDHIGPKNKNINKMRRLRLEDVKKEIEKCELVCSNCHRIRTHESRKREGEGEKQENTDLSLFKFRQSEKVEDCKELLNKYHYAGFGRSATLIYEGSIENKIISVAKFSVPIRSEIYSSLGVSPGEVLELDRLCVDPEYQVKNFLSRFLGYSIRQIKKSNRNLKFLVSFADPYHGHIGTIYRATNWKFIGITSPSYHYEDMKGRIIHKKTLWNRAKRENLTEKEYSLRMSLKRVEVPGKYKYIFKLS